MASIKVKVNIPTESILDAHNICNETFYTRVAEELAEIYTEIGAVPLRSGALTNSGHPEGHSIVWEAYGNNGFNYAAVQFYHEEFNHPITGQAHWDEAISSAAVAQAAASVII